MMASAKQRKPVFQPQFLAPGLGRLVLAALAWLPAFALPLVLSHFGRLALPVLVLAFFGSVAGSLAIASGSRRIGVTVTADGFRERRLMARSQLVRWDEVSRVEWASNVAVVHHAHGQTRLAPPLEDWAAIAARAEQELPGAAANLPGSDDFVPTWLGADAQREYRDRPVCRWLWPPLMVLVVCAFCDLLDLLVNARQVESAAAVLAIVWVYLASVVVLLQASGMVPATGADNGVVRTVKVSAAGLEVRDRAGQRSYGWGELMGVTRRGLFRVVATTRGDIWLPPWIADRRQLLQAVEGALDARRAGLDLPRMTGEVPAAALSRAALSVDAERGLSREE